MTHIVTVSSWIPLFLKSTDTFLTCSHKVVSWTRYAVSGEDSRHQGAHRYGSLPSIAGQTFKSSLISQHFSIRNLHLMFLLIGQNSFDFLILHSQWLNIEYIYQYSDIHCIQFVSICLRCVFTCGTLSRVDPTITRSAVWLYSSWRWTVQCSRTHWTHCPTFVQQRFTETKWYQHRPQTVQINQLNQIALSTTLFLGFFSTVYFCISRVNFCSLKIYLCNLKVYLYFESILLYLESIPLYFECIPLYFESILLYFESTFVYFESILLYFQSILLYFESIL